MSVSQDRRCWISLGGNLGDVRQAFDSALLRLERDFLATIGVRSGLYQSVPVGNQSTTAYLNAVCEIITHLSPRELLGALHQIENQLGRVRNVRWGSRSIDLDLISYSNFVIHEPDLIVPHPGVVYRRFVLDPLVEANPQWLHPEIQVSSTELVSRLQTRPLEIQLDDFPANEADQIKLAITSKHPDVRFSQRDHATHEILSLRSNLQSMNRKGATDKASVVDLSRIPGTMLERIESVLTAIFDAPHRISDW